MIYSLLKPTPSVKHFSNKFISDQMISGGIVVYIDKKFILNTGQLYSKWFNYSEFENYIIKNGSKDGISSIMDNTSDFQDFYFSKQEIDEEGELGITTYYIVGEYLDNLESRLTIVEQTNIEDIDESVFYHNNLSGLQGGANGFFYHLDEEQYENVTSYLSAVNEYDVSTPGYLEDKLIQGNGLLITNTNPTGTGQTLVFELDIQEVGSGETLLANNNDYTLKTITSSNAGITLDGTDLTELDFELTIQEGSSNGTSFLTNEYTIKRLIEGIGLNISTTTTEITLDVDLSDFDTSDILLANKTTESLSGEAVTQADANEEFVIRLNSTIPSNYVPYTGAITNVDLGIYGITSANVNISAITTAYNATYPNRVWDDDGFVRIGDVTTISENYIPYIGAIYDVDLGNNNIFSNDYYKNNLTITWTPDSTFTVSNDMEMIDCMYELTYGYNSGRVLAGTGHEIGDGLMWYSDDEGVTWTSATGISTKRIYDIMQASSGTILSGTDNGGTTSVIYRSTDDGETYSTTTFADSNTRVISLVETSTGKLLAGTRYHNGTLTTNYCRIYQSSDDGATWTLLTNLNTSLYGVQDIYQSSVAVGAATHPRIYASCEGPSTSLLYYSDDDGVTWSVSTGTTDSTDIKMLLKIQEVDNNRLLITSNTGTGSGNAKIFYSDDYGDTLTENLITTDVVLTSINDVKYLSNRKIIAAVQDENNDTCIYYSEDNGLSWIRNDITTPSVVRATMSIEELISGRVLVGTISSGTNGNCYVYRSDDIRKISNLYTYIENLDTQVTNIVNGSLNLENYVPYTGATTDVELGAHLLSTTSSLRAINPSDPTDYVNISYNNIAFTLDNNPSGNIISSTSGENYIQLQNSGGTGAIKIWENGGVVLTGSPITINSLSSINEDMSILSGKKMKFGDFYIIENTTTDALEIYRTTGNVLLGSFS